jgi:DNA-binding PadR family transcriptional regulator
MGIREDRQDAAAYLPLTPAVFHVLLALADGDKHGYAIMKDVRQRTEGKVRLSAGTLYGIINRLLGDGMIVETRDRPSPALDDERRRYYRLTNFGREVAIADAVRMENAIAMARSSRLLLPAQPEGELP